MNAILAVAMLLFVGHSLTPHVHDYVAGQQASIRESQSTSWLDIMNRLYALNLGSGHLEHVSSDSEQPTLTVEADAQSLVNEVFLAHEKISFAHVDFSKPTLPLFSVVFVFQKHTHHSSLRAPPVA